MRQHTVHGKLCRQDAPNLPCKPVDAAETASPIPVPGGSDATAPVVWKDTLPPELTVGPARPLVYRVELANDEGRSAGPSDPAYSAAGQAPQRVQQFTAEGVRSGVLLQWSPAQDAGAILLTRERLGAAAQSKPVQSSATSPTVTPGKKRHPAATIRESRRSSSANPGTVLLQAPAGQTGAVQLLDGSVIEGVLYRYTAVRRETTRVGGRTLDLRSGTSAPVEITWHDVYPPLAPQDLTALGFMSSQAGTSASPAASKPEVYAVDLIWHPVNDARVTGYVVTRSELGAAGTPERLTATPVVTPSFHDTTADPAKSYRYEVTAVDAKGNTSPAATATVQAASR